MDKEEQHTVLHEIVVASGMKLARVTITVVNADVRILRFPLKPIISGDPSPSDLVTY